MTVRATVVSWAARAEQEIRSYPRAYAALYTLMHRVPAVRRGVGAVKRRVRTAGSTGRRVVAAPDDPRVVDARTRAVRARLDL